MLIQLFLRRVALAVIILSTSLPSFAQSTGIKPRADAKHYAATTNVTNATIGAAQLSPKQVQRSFTSDISKDYIVVEVGLFPAAELKVSTADFVLRIKGQADLVRPLEPKTIAANIEEKKQKANDVDVYPMAGVRWESGPDPNDPNYYNDPNRGSRVTTSAGVGVGVSGKQKSPQTIEAERNAIIAELSKKALPEVASSKPIAGYIYFPAPTDKRVLYELEYQGHTGSVVLALPAPTQ